MTGHTEDDCARCLKSLDDFGVTGNDGIDEGIAAGCRIHAIFVLRINIAVREPSAIAYIGSTARLRSHSLMSMGKPKMGPFAMPFARASSASRAAWRATGEVCITARRVGPARLTSSIRAK